jgi:hypothetical protein
MTNVGDIELKAKLLGQTYISATSKYPYLRR